MRHTLWFTMALAGVLLLPHLLASPGRQYAPEQAPRLPPFTSTDPVDWHNSDPLQVSDLVGQVVLLDVWTFQCWNCYRSFPWLTGLEDRFAGQDFRIIGIHTPEFESEKDRQAVAEAIVRFGLHHPVMMDNDHAYWRALGNRFWPAYYLVDARGRIRDVYIGETHAGDAQARRIESRIGELLEEATQG